MSVTDAAVCVYVTSAWGEVYATLEDAQQGCDEYLSRCYNHAEPHVEDGTDEAGWFQFGESLGVREWRRYFTDRDHPDPMHFRPQTIQERVLRGDLSRDLPSTETFNEQCQPTGKCTCLGHRFPNVHHIAPCCDEPHIDSATRTLPPEGGRA